MFLNTKGSYLNILIKELSGQLLEFGFRTFLGLIIIKKLSNHLGPELYGSLLFIESNYLLFLGLSVFGFEPLFIKYFSNKVDIKKYLINGIYLSFLISIIFFIIFYFFTFNFLDFEYSNYLFYVSFLILLNTSFFAEYFLHSENKIRYISLIKTFAYIIGFVLKIQAIYSGSELFYFIQIIIIENVIIHLIYYLILIKKFYIDFKFEFPDFSLLKKIFFSTFYVFLYGLGVNLFSRIDILMIEKYLDLKDLGNYTAAFKLVSFTYVFPVLLATTFYPKILKVKENNKNLISKMYFFSFWTSVLIFFFVFVITDQIIDFFYNENFNSVKIIFKISIIPILFGGISATYIKRLYMKEKQKNIFIRSVFGIILNIILNLLLIPNYGVVGVSIATVTSILILEIVYDFFDSSLREEHVLKLRSILKYN